MILVKKKMKMGAEAGMNLWIALQWRGTVLLGSLKKTYLFNQAKERLKEDVRLLC